MSLQRLNALCEFLQEKLNFFFIFFEQGCNIWQEKDENAYQLKFRVNQKPRERNIRPFDYFDINRISSAKRSGKDAAVRLTLHQVASQMCNT